MHTSYYQYRVCNIIHIIYLSRLVHLILPNDIPHICEWFETGGRYFSDLKLIYEIHYFKNPLCLNYISSEKRIKNGWVTVEKWQSLFAYWGALLIENIWIFFSLNVTFLVDILCKMVNWSFSIMSSQWPSQAQTWILNYRRICRHILWYS